jgi:hypothetical protein
MNDGRSVRAVETTLAASLNASEAMVLAIAMS